MTKTADQHTTQIRAKFLDTTQPQIGRLCPSNNEGVIMVECAGHPPAQARLLSGMDRKALSSRENTGREVLLIFENGEPSRPIIVGILEDPIQDLVSLEVVSPEGKNGEKHVLVDGDKILLKAEREITLQCGKGSITVKKDGKIIIKGTNILSRASQTNKIKGGSVELN